MNGAAPSLNLGVIGNGAASGGGHVQPLYGVGLERELHEDIVTTLPGCQGHTPVRPCGHQAHEHFQHDVCGNIVLGAAQAFHDQRRLRHAGLGEFKLHEAVSEQAVRVHNPPDAGLWELRTRASMHTSSLLMMAEVGYIDACDPRFVKTVDALDPRPGSGQMWGNFPQTHSMVGLMNGAVRLSAPWDTVI